MRSHSLSRDWGPGAHKESPRLKEGLATKDPVKLIRAEGN